MGFVVLAVGALLTILGAYEIYYGSGVIAVERGWSAFIGGSVLFAGGVVTAAIGLAIHVLLDLRRLLPAAIGAAAAPRPADLAPVPLPHTDLDAPATRPEPDLAVLAAAPLFDAIPPAVSAPAPYAADPGHDPEEARAFREPVLDERADPPEPARTGGTDPEPALPSPILPSPTLPSPTLPVTEAYEPPPPAPVQDEHAAPEAAEPPPLDADFVELVPAHEAPAREPYTAEPYAPEPRVSGAPAAAPEEAERHGDDVTVAAREIPAAASPVIGRYESEGTSYVMYADGSIDAQSSAGVYRFASMAELKRFIEG